MKKIDKGWLGIMNTLKSVFVDNLFKLGMVVSRTKVLEATTAINKPKILIKIRKNIYHRYQHKIENCQ